jgi:hypothetical protein
MSFPIPQEWTPELDLAAAGDHPLAEFAELAVVERFPVKPSVMRDLLGTAIRQISFSDPRIDEVSGRAIGTREKKRDDNLGGTERKLLLVGFRPVPGLPGSCRLAWIVLEEGSQRPHEDDFRKMRDFRRVIVSLIAPLLEAKTEPGGAPKTDPTAPPHDSVLGPGEDLEGLYTGNLRTTPDARSKRRWATCDRERSPSADTRSAIATPACATGRGRRTEDHGDPRECRDSGLSGLARGQYGEVLHEHPAQALPRIGFRGAFL